MYLEYKNKDHYHEWHMQRTLFTCYNALKSKILKRKLENAMD